MIDAESVGLLWERVFRRLDLSQQACAPLLGFARVETFGRKSPVINAGEPWQKLYFIQTGLLRMFYIDLQGRDFNKAFFWQGQCIWPVAPIDRAHPIKFNIAAIEATVAITLPISQLQPFLAERGKWERFSLPFAERLVESKFRREHDFLLLTATERYQNFCEEHPAIVSRIPDYHMASYLGITNVSLSRIKRDL